jgi:Tfp pilus assembly protein PilP
MTSLVLLGWISLASAVGAPPAPPKAEAPSAPAAAAPAAAAPAPAATQAAPLVASSSPTGIQAPNEDMLKMRDPFKRPDIEEVVDIKKSELEGFAIDTLKMVGTISGPDKTKAMIVAPDGHTYFVTVNTKIGLRGGYVRKITAGGIQVREKVVNVLGQEEDLDTVLKLGGSEKKASQ